MTGFFTRKSESLAQSFVDTVFKGIVTTLVIGSLATFVGWTVDQKIEVYEKRQALRVLQNQAVSAGVETLAEAFSDKLGCARQNALVKQAECRTLLNNYSVRLNSKIAVVVALTDTDATSVLDAAVTATDALIEAASDQADVRPRIAAFDAAIRAALTELAREFR